MSHSRSLAATLLAAALVAAPLTGAAQAAPSASSTSSVSERQAAKAWATIATVKGAKAQMCRQVFGSEGAYYPLIRVDAKKSTSAASASWSADVGGISTVPAKTGSTAPGKRSKAVKTAPFAATAPYVVKVKIVTKSGKKSSGTIALSALPAC